MRRLTLLAIGFAAVLAALAVAPARSLADACTPPVSNQIACENSKPGTPPSQWEVQKAGDDTIQGYATSMSVNHGQSISFKIKSNTSNYQIDIYRIGYYGGDGARLIASAVPHTGTGAQPDCLTDSSTGLIDCGNWSVSATWAVPADAVSGVYLAHLQTDTGDDSQIPFVVRDDGGHESIVLQTSDATWEAYNTYGGNSLYQCTVACPPGNPRAYKGAYKVSYNRPFHTAADDSGRSWLFSGAEYPMIRFLERSGYDVSYISSSDVASRGSLLLDHKLFMSSGHDEYWSASQRANVEAARDAGVNLAFFTGNEVFWKTRWEASTADGTSTDNRTLVSYKDTHFTTPQDPVTWTGTWRDPRFTTDADNVKPENALTGQSFVVNSGTSAITVPYAYGKLRLWRNTAAANLSPGDSLTLAPSTLGYEWDVDADNGFRPPGEIDLSSTTVTGLELFTDYGSTTATGGTATHSLTLYRAPSGALVFGSGTVQWAWGLDSENPAGDTPDVNMQQATVNLLADMGAQPATLFSPLVPASASTDHTAPTSRLTSPPSTVADGSRVTLTGTATDAGGGAVAGVEVSTDGGTTWHPASGTTDWTYSWVAHGNPSTQILTRATDDSGNIETPGAGTTVAVTCPCSIWGAGVTPPAGDVDSGDPTPVEVGVKFKPDVYGTVTGVRFYKATANVGTHIGSLWTADGTRLARATFTNESASGWQTVTFDSPVAVQPNTTYVASYYAPSGHYSASATYFYGQPAPGPNGGSMVDSPPLHALRNTGSTTNGAFLYSQSSVFPTNSFSAGNYWVDPIFSPTPPPGAVSDVSAVAGGRTSANVTWSAPTTGGSVTSYTITPYIDGVAQAPKVITGTPPLTSATVTGLTNGTTYTFTVKASNPNGSGPESAQSGAVTPLVPVAPSVPTGVSAQPASQSARVNWSAPDSNGDSPITGYTVTPYVGSTGGTPVTVDASTTQATITGLTNGTSYTFRVTASNAAGTSPSSAPTSAVTPDATLFDFSAPQTPDAGDGLSVEVGTKFTADYDGQIVGIRFYKSAANTGTHVGSLWSSTGQRLAQATFSSESASGWQSVMFSTPVAVTAGNTYVASYFAPSGHYAADPNGFAQSVDRGYLHGVATGTSPNGVYAYGSASTFPTSTYKGANYWVDVLYAVPAPGKPTAVTAAEGGRTSANLTWTAPTGGGPVSSYQITAYSGSTAVSTTNAGGSATSASVGGLTAGTTYTFKIQAVNANGPGPLSDASNAVTPSGPVAPSAPTNVQAQPASGSAQVSWNVPTTDGDSAISGYTITPFDGGTAQTPVEVDASATSKTIAGLTNGHSYTFKVKASNGVGTGPASAASSAVTPDATLFDFAKPTTGDAGDKVAVELGVKFTSDFPGSVTGIRFYKGTGGNVGTHVGSLWSSSGERLAQATFTGETDSGWQSATFASPVAITPGTTYVASYFAPKGHYSVTNNGLASAVVNAPLRTIPNGTSANGVYAYSGTSTFPTSSFGASNYGVDVLFDPAPAPGKVTDVSATAGRQAANVSWTAPSSGGPATSYEVTPYIGSNPQQSVTVTGSPAAPTSASVPGLTAGTAYTFTVQASNLSGKGAVSDPSNAVTPTGAAAPGAPTAVTADADTKSANVSWNAPSDTGGSSITGYTVTAFDGTTAQGQTQVGAQTTATRVTGLTNGRSYTFTVSATNVAGTGPQSTASNAATPLASLLDLGTPATVDAGESKATNLGVKFTSDVAGDVTGIRFYKAAANTGTHVGSLWSSSGQLLAQATFSGESASGWQTAKFSAPVTIAANTTYIASYLAPKGHYSTTASAFAVPIDNAPLHGLANSVSVNGVYAYSASPIFPTSAYRSTNYWVDLLFAAAGS